MAEQGVFDFDAARLPISVRVEPDAAQGPSVPRSVPGQDEQLLGGVRGRIQGGNEQERAAPREWSSNGPGAFELCTRCVVCETLRREGKVVWR